MLDPLFKRTATGAIQMWEIETDIHGGRYRTIHGQVDGVQTTSKWTDCKPKNVGRANATTPAEQVQLEVKALWDKKKKAGYSETIGDAKVDARFKCMTALNYNDPRRKAEVLEAAAKGMVRSQPKLDGIRCIATRFGLMSRGNTPIVSVPHINRSLERLFKEAPDAVFDGELYNHALARDFDELISIARKSKPTPADIEKAENSLHYWVYDIAGPGIDHEPYSIRYEYLRALIDETDDPYLQVVTSPRVRTEQQIDDAYEGYLASDFEGQMLRIDAPYDHGKKSKYLIKRKEFEDAEFLVLDVLEGEGNRRGEAGFVVVKERRTNKQFSANITGDGEKRLEYLHSASKYIGGDVTIRFNGRTPDGIPRFPRAVTWWPGGRNL